MVDYQPPPHGLGYTDIPPYPVRKKKKKNILCILFGHKYYDRELEPGFFEPTCKRCGHERDVHEPNKKEKK